MNELICSASAGLSGAILLTREAVISKGVPKSKAYAMTQAIILDAVVKMIDYLKEGMK